MISISKDEKEYISSRYPDIHIRRTMAQRSGRHRYYMEETPRALGILGAYRKTVTAHCGQAVST